ncbi:DNA-binding FadR family transcriptional regulator [Nocardioides luteus]|uniref:GntR family transcriptional regulator n=1 Tax=Nocardioides luteus TaxID=1844 RepID=A0ABQ5T0M3_9ACTN|nr:FadR/GntR family transcriptional regulator [Nocardioides luteus]MDR7311665.1 DNA-binding FadR family transcriptional regulator [Nocardioides luteus]GGR72622.1 GntR family transcriptional regulator [Nocardioides luteus]GLJ70003.1 GntR family transcriptional regulator [Nocardioides luteus]
MTMSSGLADRVVSGIKDQILSGDLAPGAKLPSESDLVATYGVSRTVAREAITRLRAEGLVETFQGRGSFVLAVPAPSPFALESSAIRTQHDVLDMVDFRLGVECEAAALAARELDEETARSIEEAREALATAHPDEAVEADFAFHRAVAAATGNRFYLDLMDSLGPMMIMLPRTQLSETYSHVDALHVERVQREHDNIAEAILAGDADTARAAMRVHLGSTRRRLQQG